MANPKKTAGGAKAAEPPTTPAAETPPATETTAVETPPAPTPEELEAQVDATMEAVFGPTSSAVNAKIQAERQKENELETPAAEEDLPQDEAPEGGEKERSAEPKHIDPKTRKIIESEPEQEQEPEATKLVEERFVPGATTPDIEEIARAAARDEIESRDYPAPDGNGAATVPRGTLNNEEGLSDAAQDQLVVLKEMAAINPAHRDLPGRQKEFWKKEEKHRSQWQQANPGSVFDPNSEDHADFYRKNEPFVPMRDFKAAERSIISSEAEERAVNRVRKEQEPRLREIELKEREREAAPAIANSMADAAEEVFAAAPQFKDAFKPKELSKESVQKMMEINPALAQIAREEAEMAAVLVGELEKLDRLKGHYPVNPAKQHRLTNGQTIAPHAILEAEFAETEAALLAKPESERTRDGKKLIPYEKAMERAQRIHTDAKLRPDQKNRAIEDLTKGYWWVQSGDVAKHIRTKKVARVSQFAESFAKTTKPPAQSATANGSTAAPPAKPQATPAKSSGKAGLARGTNTASSSDVADNAPKAQSELQKTTEYLAKAAFP